MLMSDHERDVIYNSLLSDTVHIVGKLPGYSHGYINYKATLLKLGFMLRFDCWSIIE